MRKNDNANILMCPVCKNELVAYEDERLYRCSENHSFDIAKQGYLNLLTSNQKRSKSPGDSKEMVLARREFLSKGYYSELSDKINEMIISSLENKSCGPCSILDIGCGEGYYVDRLYGQLKSKGICANLYGGDISKDAIRYASSSNKNIRYIVGNSFSTPFSDGSFDCVFSVFSPIDMLECRRILKNDGVFIRVLPGVNHLIQIRNVIYPEVILNDGRDQIEKCDGMRYVDTLDVSFDIRLSTPEILSLVRMTPHYWKTSKENKEALNHIGELDVTIDMKILSYERYLPL